MFRDLDALTSHTFDLLVVGGGIHGLMAAWDASTRGLHVALIERHDFGGATSFHHHRTLHGGLRYLQSANLPRLRQSARERRTWARMAPHLIERQPFAVRAGGPDGKSAGAAARRVSPSTRRSRPTGTRACPTTCACRPAASSTARSAPRLDTGTLLGDGPVGVWHDYRTTHAERLTFAVAIAAVRAGAVHGQLRGCHRADSAGPHDRRRDRARSRRRRDAVDQRPRAAQRHRRGRRPADGRLRRATAAAARQGDEPGHAARRRPPWRAAPPRPTGGCCSRCHGRDGWPLAPGTAPTPCGADAAMVTPEEFDAFLAGVNEAFPDLALTADDVTLVQRGVVPAAGLGQPRRRWPIARCCASIGTTASTARSR